MSCVYFCNWITCSREIRTYLCKLFCRMNVKKAKVKIFGYIKKTHNNTKNKSTLTFNESKKVIHQFGAGISHMKVQLPVLIQKNRKSTKHCFPTSKSSTILYLSIFTFHFQVNTQKKTQRVLFHP